MPVYDDHKLIFHHVPKTGGRAINAWLGGSQELEGHMPIHSAMKYLDSRRASGYGYRLAFPSFTVIRDPFDRIRSAWMHHKRNEISTTNDWPHLFERDFESALLHDDFQKLMRDTMRSVHFYPLSWMFVENGKLSIPDISLDFDNLERDTDLLAERFELWVDPFVFSPTLYDTHAVSHRAMEKFRWLYREDYDIIAYQKTRLIHGDS